MQIWQIWAIIALILIIIEIFTPGFALLCIAIGAIGGSIVSAFHLSYAWQIIVFAVVTAVCFIFVRPVLLKIFYTKKDRNILTNADALIGKMATVTETIDGNKDEGRIKIDGDDWKAVSEDGSIIEKGNKVTVTKIDSIILTVKLKSINNI